MNLQLTAGEQPANHYLLSIEISKFYLAKDSLVKRHGRPHLTGVFGGSACLLRELTALIIQASEQTHSRCLTRSCCAGGVACRAKHTKKTPERLESRGPPSGSLLLLASRFTAHYQHKDKGISPPWALNSSLPPTNSREKKQEAWKLARFDPRGRIKEWLSGRRVREKAEYVKESETK
ncbi:hypothetical protein E2C01_052292 [Portunus trituberculatus]|uniref:Uncharacterized protein n=1 Tax=Portunus trituberculatus TaxID=210409 RepID=A0A5B7GL49_PORTR|nr:hypothetical protein [Portunus trituberculatus]